MMLHLALASFIAFGPASMTTQVNVGSEVSRSLSSQGSGTPSATTSQAFQGHPSIATRPQGNTLGNIAAERGFSASVITRIPRVEGPQSATSSTEGSASHLN